MIIITFNGFGIIRIISKCMCHHIVQNNPAKIDYGFCTC